MRPAGDLSPEMGFFRFGPSICYGQSSSGARQPVPDNLDDLRPLVTATHEHLVVPFDPSQVVDNLRYERYRVGPSSGPPPGRSLWHTLYYTCRPFMPDVIRRLLQRFYFRAWRAIPFPRWPLDDTVDQLIEQLLLLSLQQQGGRRMPFVWFWPDGAPSSAIITHDVETSVGQDRCSWLMDLDDAYGVKASFQIVPEDRYRVTSQFLEGIRSRGFEVNVHDLNHDGLLFGDRDEFRRRAQRINGHARDFGARGFRSGALYRHPDWYDSLDVDYDMSIPNVAHLEVQRGGCCTVMPYFVGRIVELPLTTTQDYSLFHILRDFSSDLWEDQLKLITDRHGLASFIVHPDYLDPGPAQQAYRGLLARLAGLREAGRSWIALPGAVETWWRARSQMTVVRDGDGWRVEGPGKERARVAYAEVASGSLVYSLEPEDERRRRASAP